MRLKLVALIALIGGPILGYSIRQETNERAQIAKEGVTVPGVIQDGEVSTGRRGSKTTRFNVEYTIPSGQKTVKRFRVPGEFAEKYVKEGGLIRDDVEVRCLPSNPEKAILIGAGDGSPELEYVGYGAGVAGLVGTFLTFRRKKQPAEESFPQV